MVLCPAGVVDLTPFAFLNRLADLVPLNPKVICDLPPSIAKSLDRYAHSSCILRFALGNRNDMPRFNV